MVSEVIDPFGKKMKKITKIKRKKLCKLSGESNIKELVSERFTEHLSLINFLTTFLSIVKRSLQTLLILLVW